MALQWNWSDKMGKMTVKQRDRKYSVNIYDGNCLAIFLYEYKDENGKDMYSMYNFLLDEKHCNNIIKEHKKLFEEDTSGIELNLRYPNAKKFLNILVKNGYKVKCYYK